MATFVLIHGAGSDSSYWHLVRPKLEASGHDVIAPDLPCDDESKTFRDYARLVIDAAAGRSDVVLVAQSLAGFTAPLVCEERPVELLVLVNAMIPAPGESAGDWWANTGQPQAMVENADREGRKAEAGGLMNDPEWTFLHDVPREALTAPPRAQAGRPFAHPFPLDKWPDVPTRVLVGRNDRLFPAAFQKRVAEERLGITPDVIRGGHLVALSNPDGVAEKLLQYRD
jgi:pimeloyl-ACP methyl ester carboxylesterase